MMEDSKVVCSTANILPAYIKQGVRRLLSYNQLQVVKKYLVQCRTNINEDVAHLVQSRVISSFKSYCHDDGKAKLYTSLFSIALQQLGSSTFDQAATLTVEMMVTCLDRAVTLYRHYSKTDAQEYRDTEMDAFSCLHCNELLYQPVTLSCGHSFCTFCFDIMKTRNCKCFKCRKAIKNDEQQQHRVNVTLMTAIQKWFPEEWRGRALMGEGLALLAAGKYAGAADKLTEALEIIPHSHVSYLHRAKAHYHLDNLGQALEDCSKSIFLSRKSAQAYFLKGEILLRLKFTQHAAVSFLISLFLEPCNEAALVHLNQIIAQSLPAALRASATATSSSSSSADGSSPAARKRRMHSSATDKGGTTTALSAKRACVPAPARDDDDHSPTPPTLESCFRAGATAQEASRHHRRAAADSRHLWRGRKHGDCSIVDCWYHGAKTASTSRHDAAAGVHWITYAAESSSPSPGSSSGGSDDDGPASPPKIVAAPPGDDSASQRTAPPPCVDASSRTGSSSALATEQAMEQQVSPDFGKWEVPEQVEHEFVMSLFDLDRTLTGDLIMLCDSSLSSELMGILELPMRPKKREVEPTLVDQIDFECSLCMRLFYDPVSTLCGHVFCQRCIERCLDHNVQCPLCKQPLHEYLAESLRSLHHSWDQTVKLIIEQNLPEAAKLRKKQHFQEIEELTQSQPIFVCTIAFPSVPCPLHIFEPRYRLMLRRCLDHNEREFGMCMPLNDQPHHDIGTQLKVRNVTFFPDGRSVVDCVGCRRFRTSQCEMKDGYNVAKLHFIRDTAVDDEQTMERLIHIRDKVFVEATDWFKDLPPPVAERIINHFGNFPVKDDNFNTENGPDWLWWVLAVLPVEDRVKATILGKNSLRERLLIVHRIFVCLKQRKTSSVT